MKEREDESKEVDEKQDLSGWGRGGGGSSIAELFL